MPGYRGRLIQPQLARVYRLDTGSTALTDPGDATGAPLGAGMDDDFREPVLAPAVAPGGLAPQRIEHDPLDLPCQVEVPRFNDEQPVPGGDDSARQLVLVFHFADLETAGLLDENGEPMLRLHDRLEGLYRLDTGALIQRMSVPVYATKVEPRSFGLSGGTRNLLAVTFSERGAWSGDVAQGG